MSRVVLSPRAARRMNVFIKKVGRGINRHRMIEPGENNAPRRINRDYLP